MTAEVTILPADPGRPPEKRLTRCTECQAELRSVVREFVASDGERGRVWFAECFSCGAIALTAFKDEEGE